MFQPNGKLLTPAALHGLRRGLMLCLFSVAVSCSGELPECPAGTAFDDCKASTVPLLPAASAAGAGGSGGMGPVGVASGSGGSSAEAPAAPSTFIPPPPPPVAAPAPVAMAPAADTCLDDPLKNAPGVCGCGVPDNDFDADGAMDCSEACPDNAARTTPMGACGCSNLTDTAGCTALRNALRNLYTFDGTGLQVIDSLGGQNGVVADAVGTTAPAALAQLQQNGRLNLDGFGSYVDLPNGLISTLTGATFEVWLSWRGGGPWARIFDFGSTNPANPANGQTYLFLTPLNSLTNNLRVAYSIAGPAPAETLVDAQAPLPIATSQDRTLQHVAVVVDDAAGMLRLYANGLEVGNVAFAGDLALIQDTNNWLGRSNYSVDPPLFASLIEFRIYDQALTAAQLGISFRAGPGALGE